MRNHRSGCVGKTPKFWIFGRLASLGAFLAEVGTIGVTERVEIEALIMELLTVSRAGAPIMKLNGKSRLRCSKRRLAPFAAEKSQEPAQDSGHWDASIGEFMNAFNRIIHLKGYGNAGENTF